MLSPKTMVDAAVSTPQQWCGHRHFGSRTLPDHHFLGAGRSCRETAHLMHIAQHHVANACGENRRMDERYFRAAVAGNGRQVDARGGDPLSVMRNAIGELHSLSFRNMHAISEPVRLTNVGVQAWRRGGGGRHRNNRRVRCTCSPAAATRAATACSCRIFKHMCILSKRPPLALTCPATFLRKSSYSFSFFNPNFLRPLTTALKTCSEVVLNLTNYRKAISLVIFRLFFLRLPRSFYASAEEEWTTAMMNLATTSVLR